MKTQNLAFVDLEMTGLDPFEHEILEIGIVLAVQSSDRQGKLTIELLSEHDIQLIPEHIENADPEGLLVNKYHSRDWSKAVPQKEGLTQALNILDGSIFIAQNVAVDWTFLRKVGHDHGVDFDAHVHYHKLDLASMAFAKHYQNSKLLKFSLREMSQYFKVKNKDAHTALSDARATFEICKILLES